MKEYLVKNLDNIGIELSDEQVSQFISYYEMLVEWNKVMNLTAITEYEEVVRKHFVDSLMIAKLIDMNEINSVIDIGTGAGFPGIPLKIAYPHLNLTLLDSLNKRIKFLDHVVDQLKLGNITAMHGRAEDFAKQKEYREKFDLCVSRAVANLTTLSEYCIPYVKVGGRFTPYKSGSIEEEINDSKSAIKLLGGKINKVEKFNLPGTDIERSIIIIKKEKNTDKKYPRKAGMPAKEPLK